MTTGFEPTNIERRASDNESWHLDKKVPLGFILALIVQTVTIVIAFQDIKRDVALLQANQIVLEKRDAAQVTDLHDAMMQTREQYKALDEKLNRLIERRNP